MKTLGNIANLHDLRTNSRTRRSAKPALPTTAVLGLYMARNERDRLTKERMRLAKRKVQIDRRLTEIEEEMDELLKAATKKATEIRGQAGMPEEISVKKADHDHEKTVVGY